MNKTINNQDKRFEKISATSHKATEEFRKSIEQLEIDNHALQVLSDDIESEIKVLDALRDSVYSQQNENTTVIQGLKNVLSIE